VSPLGKGTAVGLWAVVSLLSPASGGAATERGGVAGSVEVLRLCCCWWLVWSVRAVGRLRKERTMERGNGEEAVCAGLGGDWLEKWGELALILEIKRQTSGRVWLGLYCGGAGVGWLVGEGDGGRLKVSVS